MFNLSDFDVFNDETLEGRLAKIKKVIDPKFEKFGYNQINVQQEKFNNTLYMHISKHARRHKNPPPDTWVAISDNKRGYKKYPHIEIGFWSDCIFTNFSLLTDIDMELRSKLLDKIKLSELMKYNFGISTDHTNSQLKPLNENSFKDAKSRYLQVKSSDFVIGYIYPKIKFTQDTNKLINENMEQIFSILNKYEK